MEKTLFVGLDVHKRSVSVATAEEGRRGAVRFVGDIPNEERAVAEMIERMAQGGQALDFCYEAGCCGYVLHRQITAAGHACTVAAPSRIPQTPGREIKTDRRDAQRLAVLHRSGNLTAVWFPDSGHEAMRDLVRGRADAALHLMRCRQQLLAFLLRHGRVYEPNRKHWTLRHRRWLSAQGFEDPAQNIVYQDYIEAVWTAAARHDALVKHIAAQVPSWSLGPLVGALRCLRGLDLISASTFVAAVGDLGRFDTPRQLMGYLGLTPSEHSSGPRTRRGSITKAGSSEARRMLVEAGWSYRYPGSRHGRGRNIR